MEPSNPSLPFVWLIAYGEAGAPNHRRPNRAITLREGVGGEFGESGAPRGGRFGIEPIPFT